MQRRTSKKKERACASMASMVSEIEFALLERTKRLVTPTEEIVGGGCWESARRCWEWGGKAKDGNSKSFRTDPYFSLQKNQSASFS